MLLFVAIELFYCSLNLLAQRALGRFYHCHASLRNEDRASHLGVLERVYIDPMFDYT